MIEKCAEHLSPCYANTCPSFRSLNLKLSHFDNVTKAFTAYIEKFLMQTGFIFYGTIWKSQIISARISRFALFIRKFENRKIYTKFKNTFVFLKNRPL